MQGDRWIRPVRQWLSRPEVSATLVVYGMLAMITVTFVLMATDLPPWRFYGTLLGLATLTALYLMPGEEPASRHDPHVRGYFVRYLLPIAALVLVVNWLGLKSEHNTFLPYLLFIVMGHGISTLPLPWALLYGFGAEGAFLTMLHVAYEVPLAEVWQISHGFTFGMFFVALFSLMAVRYAEQNQRVNQLLAELRAANEQLEASRARERKLAVAEERVRLARDIHDGLGHHLSVLNVQLQAARKLLDRDPARAAPVVATCQEVAQAALREVRQSVSSLRRTPLDGRSLDEALRQLVAEFDRHSPIVARFEQYGDARPVSHATAMTLFRTAQEGLTNAQKHAVAAHATVVLRYGPARVTVDVINDGPPVAGDSSEGGFGLAGLRERAEQLGGSLVAGPQAEGGFRLQLSVPLDR